MSTNTKPLAEWTLGETREYCAGRGDCKLPYPCPFWGGSGKRCMTNFANLDLTEQPRFTEDEVADMAAVQRIFRSVVVGRLEKGAVYTSNRAMSLNEAWSSEDRITYLPERLFPSLLPGQSVTIADIIGQKENPSQ